MNEQLLGECVNAFRNARPLKDSIRYLNIMGCLHMCIRLKNILKRKNGNLWWDEDVCLKNDSALVTSKAFHALSQRASNWAARDPLTTPLSSWLDALPKKVVNRKTARVGPVKIQFN